MKEMTIYGIPFHIYHDGYTADCQFPSHPMQPCGVQVAGRTQKAVIKEMKVHLLVHLPPLEKK